MTKKEMVDAVLEAIPDGKLTKLQIETTLESYHKVIAAELLGGGEIAFQGVGKLKLKTTNARKGRDPRNGNIIDIPAGKKVVFAPFGDFKDALRS